MFLLCRNDLNQTTIVLTICDVCNKDILNAGEGYAVQEKDTIYTIHKTCKKLLEEKLGHWFNEYMDLDMFIYRIAKNTDVDMVKCKEKAIKR